MNVEFQQIKIDTILNQGRKVVQASSHGKAVDGYLKSVCSNLCDPEALALTLSKWNDLQIFF